MIEKLKKNISTQNDNIIAKKTSAKMNSARKDNAKKANKKKFNNFKRKRAFLKKKGKNFKKFKRKKRPMFFMKKIQFFNSILKLESEKNRNLLTNNTILEQKRTTFIKLLKNIIKKNENLNINSDNDFENNALINQFLIRKANIKTTLTKENLSKRALLLKWTKKSKKLANDSVKNIDDKNANAMTNLNQKEEEKKQSNLKIKRIKSWQKKSNRKLLYRKRFVTKKSRAFLIPNSHNIFKHRLNILIKPNNVFCNLSDINKNISTTDSCSAGKYKTKASKKTMRYIFESIINKFYFNIRNNFTKKQTKRNFVKGSVNNKKPYEIVQKEGGIIINVNTPRRLRKKVLRLLRNKFKRRQILYNVVEKKIFNGCRAPKKVRKKRRRMRVFK